jgi:hypothetical protein
MPRATSLRCAAWTPPLGLSSTQFTLCLISWHPHVPPLYLQVRRTALQRAQALLMTMAKGARAWVASRASQPSCLTSQASSQLVPQLCRGPADGAATPAALTEVRVV